MSVRAKFKVQAIEKTEHWDLSKGGLIGTVKLSPVMSGSAENKAFFAATPSGSIELGTVNDEALARFEIGADYYVDFTKAE